MHLPNASQSSVLFHYCFQTIIKPVSKSHEEALKFTTWFFFQFSVKYFLYTLTCKLTWSVIWSQTHFMIVQCSYINYYKSFEMHYMEWRYLNQEPLQDAEFYSCGQPDLWPAWWYISNCFYHLLSDLSRIRLCTFL